jgi:hypothetical protein
VLTVLAALVLLAAGCDASLPEPGSRGAFVLRDRCAGCHRVYAPASMTRAMWEYQVERMRGEYARRGRPWLMPDEERALLEYLARHAGG